MRIILFAILLILNGCSRYEEENIGKELIAIDDDSGELSRRLETKDKAYPLVGSAASGTGGPNGTSANGTNANGGTGNPDAASGVYDANSASGNGGANGNNANGGTGGASSGTIGGGNGRRGANSASGNGGANGDSGNGGLEIPRNLFSQLNHALQLRAQNLPIHQIASAANAGTRSERPNLFQNLRMRADGGSTNEIIALNQSIINNTPQVTARGLTLTTQRQIRGETDLELARRQERAAQRQAAIDAIEAGRAERLRQLYQPESVESGITRDPSNGEPTSDTATELALEDHERQEQPQALVRNGYRAYLDVTAP